MTDNLLYEDKNQESLLIANLLVFIVCYQTPAYLPLIFIKIMLNGRISYLESFQSLKFKVQAKNSLRP